MMFSLVSTVPHQWHSVCSWVINLRRCSVSLFPSHPILILKMYLISLIIWLFSLKYFYAFILYSLPPSSQNSFKVGNSLLMIVLCLACHRIFLLIWWLTNVFHFVNSLPLCTCINSKSVMCICLSNYFQCLMVGVCNSFAFLNMWLCKVFS